MKEQWQTIIDSINVAKTKLMLYGGESHESAMAQDKLDEARFWVTRAAIEDGE
jgi:hypothetical protein